MVEGLVQRLRSIVGARGAAGSRPKQVEEWRRQLIECAEANITLL